MSRDLPVVEPPFEGTDRARSVAGVLLAAGRSERFGERNKLLAPLDGEPLVRHAARALVAADLADAVAVVGHEADQVRAALDGLDVEFATNPDTAAGQATSVAAGIEQVRKRHDAALFALGDMPRVRPESVGALIAAYRSGAGTALAAAHEGGRGNPVLFDARHFDALADGGDDVGGRDVLLTADDAALVETGDPGVRLDVDTPADLQDL